MPGMPLAMSVSMKCPVKPEHPGTGKRVKGSLFPTSSQSSQTKTFTTRTALSIDTALWWKTSILSYSGLVQSLALLLLLAVQTQVSHHFPWAPALTLNGAPSTEGTQ